MENNIILRHKLVLFKLQGKGDLEYEEFLEMLTPKFRELFLDRAKRFPGDPGWAIFSAPHHALHTHFDRIYWAHTPEGLRWWEETYYHFFKLFNSL